MKNGSKLIVSRWHVVVPVRADVAQHTRTCRDVFCVPYNFFLFMPKCTKRFVGRGADLEFRTRAMKSEGAYVTQAKYSRRGRGYVFAPLACA